MLRERYYKAAIGKDALLSLSARRKSRIRYITQTQSRTAPSLEETEKILLQIDLDRYISEREIFEAKNLARVVSYIDKRAKEQELGFDVILSLHKMLLSNIRDDVAGIRKDDEYVRVGSHIAPAPKEINGSIEKMFAEYNATSHENIIKRIARLHLAFEYLHPFMDGNGRIGRVINNYLLIREGLCRSLSSSTERNTTTLSKSSMKKAQRELWKRSSAKRFTNQLPQTLGIFEGNKIVLLSDYAKSAESPPKPHQQGNPPDHRGTFGKRMGKSGEF